MNKVAKAILIALWVVFFSIAFAAVWIRTPALWFINLPEPAWEFLTRLLGASCCEEVADVEALVGIIFGILFSGVLFGLAITFMKALERLTNHSSGRKNGRR